MVLPEMMYMSFPRRIPQAVASANAATPSTITLRNDHVIILSATVVAPTEVPRNIVIMFMSSF